jgi:hypothetical protein
MVERFSAAILVLAAPSRLLELRLRFSDVFDTLVCLDKFAFLLPNITCFPGLELEPLSADGMVILLGVPVPRPVRILLETFGAVLLVGSLIEELVEVSEETNNPSNELSDLILGTEGGPPCKPRKDSSNSTCND